MRSKFVKVAVLLGLLVLGYFFLPERFVNPFRNALQFIASPVEKVVFAFSRKTGSLISSVTEINGLRGENNELKEKIYALMKENTDLGEVRSENELLKKEIEVRAGKPQNLLKATVINSEPSNFLESFTVDQGAEAGVKVGQAAIYQGILVGKVSSVTNSTAQITLVLSSRSIVQGELSESRIMGIVKGGLQGIYLDNISQDVPFKSGETVITSGLGGDLPKGIIIGKVDKVTTPKSEIFQTFSLTNPLDFHRIEAVFIIK